ncbi:MAG: hypothetical protein ACRCYO_09590 [Bacteroidia bacterium]
MKSRFILACYFAFSFLQMTAQNDSTLKTTGVYIFLGSSASDFSAGNEEIAQLGFRPIPWAAISFGMEYNIQVSRNIIFTGGSSFSFYTIQRRGYSSSFETSDFMLGAGPFFPILKNAKKYKCGLLLQPRFSLSQSRISVTKPSGIYSPNYFSYLYVKDQSKVNAIVGIDLRLYWSGKVKNKFCQGIGFSGYYLLTDMRWSMPAFQKYNTRLYFQISYKFRVGIIAES